LIHRRFSNLLLKRFYWLLVQHWKKAADSTGEAIQHKWKSMVEKRQDKHLSSLNNLATTLKSISDRSNRGVRIEIGLNIPDDGYGTILVTHAKDSFQFV